MAEEEGITSRHRCGRSDAREEAPEAQRVRQGQIVMRTRVERIIFVAGLSAPVIVLLAVWLAHLL